MKTNQVRVRVLNVEPSDRKLVLSMRSKTRPNSSDQGNVAMFADMLREVWWRVVWGACVSCRAEASLVGLPPKQNHGAWENVEIATLFLQ